MRAGGVEVTQAVRDGLYGLQRQVILVTQHTVGGGSARALVTLGLE